MYVFSNGDVYEGNFVAGMIDGRGTYRWKDGHSYTGEVWQGTSLTRLTPEQFSAGKRHGKGTLLWPDGAKFWGTFQDEMRSGKGTVSMSRVGVCVADEPAVRTRGWIHI